MTIDYDKFEEIAHEQRAASEELERVFAARGIADAEIPAISESDDEAIAAVRRMQAANARLGAFLKLAVPDEP
jgi:2-keto-3-deoxy-6-phosphogluconate aldolase